MLLVGDSVNQNLRKVHIVLRRPHLASLEKPSMAFSYWRDTVPCIWATPSRCLRRELLTHCMEFAKTYSIPTPMEETWWGIMKWTSTKVTWCVSETWKSAQFFSLVSAQLTLFAIGVDNVISHLCYQLHQSRFRLSLRFWPTTVTTRVV